MEFGGKKRKKKKKKSNKDGKMMEPRSQRKGSQVRRSMKLIENKVTSGWTVAH